MDKRSIIGLLIIGAILFIFSYINASQAEDAPDSTQTTVQDTTSSAVTENVSDTLIENKPEEESSAPVSHLVPVYPENDSTHQLTNNIGEWHYRDTTTGLDTFLVEKIGEPIIEKPVENLPEEIVHLENDLISVDISSKGGRIVNVLLKEFKTYNSFVNNEESPLQLFDDQSFYGVDFYQGGSKQNSAAYDFNIIESSSSSATVEMINPNGKKVGFKYNLAAGNYHVDYSIYFKGFDDRDAQDIAFTSDFKLLSTEKHLPSERRISNVFYKYEDDSYDYITMGGDAEENLEEKTEWVAFKQSYFSAILMSEAGFESNSNTKIEFISVPETDSVYIKQYKANLGLGITNINNTTDLKWYFGPNDYSILAEYGNGSEDIVDLGWGLFRWINVYFMRPIFGWLISWGMGAGIAILLLTIFVKLLLSPVNYKMYKSSAMMKVLRPEIEKITKKFPKKEDAMKKQQETMALYRETGVSPMAGCVPMLIQMPILFAIFRLFPAELSLRQKNFLWAEDLSTYDSVWNFGFDIPFYGDHMSLFTLLMAGTTLLYTHYNSSNMQQPTVEGMPNMKYIMYFFPIMMIFFFNSYSSGLSYYYFISTLMTIGIMFAIKRFMLDEDKIQAKIEANRVAPKKKKGKSKFQQRLEEAQRLQQERQKGKNK